MAARSASVNWGEWPAWLDQADQDGITPACRGEDTNLFFPDNGPGAMEAIAKARAICRRCPLQPVCEEWALAQPPHLLHGVWGGLSHAERLARKPRGQQPPQFRKHTRS